MKSQRNKKLALERAEILLREADHSFPDNPDRSHDYVNKARRVAMKVRLRLPRALKRKFCAHCYHYLMPGANCRVRIHRNKVIIFCRDCKNYTRIGAG